MSQQEFPVSAKNQVKQVAKRGAYDRQTIYRILDSSLVCNIAFVQDNNPFAIPMLFARKGDQLLFHGSTKSRLMKTLSSGQELCISVTLLDGLVLAKSLFHHSMNYRSATVFGAGQTLISEEDRLDALRIISDKVMPGRWDDARQPSAQELKATSVVTVNIHTASSKIRTGSPVDDPADLELPVWSGVVPIRQIAEAAIPDPNGMHDLTMPNYLEAWYKQFGE
jgi:nitroimidazol reductase NimA-like FMN-containing flavoprotein (pyridoxamine 5'-phosphate oxidase superfamily)